MAYPLQQISSQGRLDFLVSGFNLLFRCYGACGFSYLGVENRFVGIRRRFSLDSCTSRGTRGRFIKRGTLILSGFLASNLRPSSVARNRPREGEFDEACLGQVKFGPVKTVMKDPLPTTGQHRYPLIRSQPNLVRD